ncbi:hypothetical protein ACI2IY_16805 [Lysobacter enzymogenes]|uniref:hypothetical protein n=1 Tax=Lysobacter enzymogenes TaxID=69 RepID=UPI00384DA132
MNVSERKEVTRNRRALWLSVLALLAAACGAYLFLTRESQPGDANAAADVAAMRSAGNNESSADVKEHQENKKGGAAGRRVARSSGESVVPPPGNAQEVIAQLRAQAEAGDARAALLIHLKLYECANQQDVSMIEQTAEAIERAGASGSQYIADQQRIRKDCENSASLLSEQGKWLERAADGGDTVAQRLYALNSRAFFKSAAEMLADPAAVDRYKRKAQGYMSTLVEKGDADAMMWYVGAYEGGVMVPKDAVRAYAYYRLIEMSAPGTTSKELMDNKTKSLSAEKIAEGDALAAKLYSTCCRN